MIEDEDAAERARAMKRKRRWACAGGRRRAGNEDLIRFINLSTPMN
jgi:hypothetical protein